MFSELPQCYKILKWQDFFKVLPCNQAFNSSWISNTGKMHLEMLFEVIGDICMETWFVKWQTQQCITKY